MRGCMEGTCLLKCGSGIISLNIHYKGELENRKYTVRTLGRKYADQSLKAPIYLLNV